MTNLTSSIQVSEAVIEAGARAICSGTGDPDAFMGQVSDTARRDARVAYLAMRSKDHSIAVDDVRERVAKAIWATRQDAPMASYSLKQRMSWDEAQRAADAAITAIGSQSIEGERRIVREKCPYVLPEAMRGMQCPNCDCAEGKSGTLSGGKK